MLEMVQNLFSEDSYSRSESNLQHLSNEQRRCKKLAQEEIESMEQKGTIVAVNPSPDQFVSPLFILVLKKDQDKDQ